uniref:Uncharacterized protein n=1 Tax=Pipistrellus kuhlii TaxID=59472 RepID=A0A7J7YMC1_PIPKU|nr:hypothetical protein mPipKuh1_010140 [Pipistrellus kuhlii]
MLTVRVIVTMREECPVVAEVPSSSGIYGLGLLPVLSYLSAFQICHHYLSNPGISNPDDLLTLDLPDFPFLTTSIGEAGAPTQLLWKVLPSLSSGSCLPCGGLLPVVTRPTSVWPAFPKIQGHSRKLRHRAGSKVHIKVRHGESG